MKNTEQPISFLPLLSTEERHQLLFEWNSTFTKYTDNKCIHEVFEEQVECTPDALALMFGQDQLTYGELNQRSNQLAHYLRKKGVKEETLVAICIGRSLEMIIGIMGILKAGGAYVPIDPDYPQHRIQYMLTDSGATILVSTTEYLGLFDKQEHIIEVIDIKDEWTIIVEQPTVNPKRVSVSSNLAYVIYTSGSTGSPKGVMIEHRNVYSFICWCRQEFISSRFQIVYAATSICFDLSVFEIFYPLSIGKPIRIIENGLHIGKYLPGESGVLINSVPSVIQSLLQEGTDLSSVSVINMAGEPIPLPVQEGLDADNIEVRNLYGPTEDTTYSTVYRLKNGEPALIGKPISNTKIYILSREMQLSPIGVAGEIYIGGAGLARGYLNRPELTTERFISNPFSDEPNARLYKTGDIGRYLTDGNIVFLGRLDHQVKIRGYRIELGEIESTLGQHSAVQQVVVIAREDSPGDKRLVAYLVPDPGHKPTTSDLRNFLREKLPEYMMPSLFIFLESLPLTSNGKVDRSALPVPDLQRRDLEKSFLAPRDVIELKLTKIFEECLKVHPIGVQDNFFELGANSIQAAFIFSRIRKTLGKQLHLAILFQAPTIEQLASLLRKEEKAAPWSSLVPIQPNGSKPPIFCVHGGIGTVLFYRDLANHLGMDQPFYGLQAKGLDGIETPHSGIEEMASHYIEEIRTVQPEGPYFLGGYCLGGIVAFEMAKQLIGQGHEVALLANFNAISPTYMHPPHRTINTDEMQLDGKTKSIPAKVSHLRDKLELLSSKEKLVYLLKILKRRSWNQLKNTLWNPNTQYKMRGLLYKLCHTLGRPLPEAIAKLYLWETNAQMVRAYKPQLYPGRMTIFRSPGIYQDPHLGWSGLVGGGIETCDISGEHQYPRQIMIEPYVHLLAEELKNYIGSPQNYT